MKKYLAPLLASLLILATSGLHAVQAQSSSVSQNLGAGTIDWTHQHIKVTGTGAPPASGSEVQKRLMARRAAIADGYRQLAEIINGVQVDSETTVRNMVTEQDEIRLKVSALVKAAVPGQTRNQPDGGVEVDMVMPLFGTQSVAAAIELDKSLEKQQQRFKQQSFWDGVSEQVPVWMPGQQYALKTKVPVKPVHKPVVQPTAKPVVKPTPKPTAKPAAQPTPQPSAPTPVEVQGYTGLIIDASGLSVQPAMSPALLSSDQQQIYVGDFELDVDRVIAEGIVTYYHQLKDAARAGQQPLVVKALKTGDNGVDLVISPEDAQLIQTEDTRSHFLSRLNVAVVF
jgi:hypothetical protein